jgi:hypothetical protein
VRFTKFRLVCATCGQLFRTYRRGYQYCSIQCEVRPAPIVYRYVCPDGRSYVGFVGDGRDRDRKGICRTNERLRAAFEQHPPETWTFEVLERCALDVAMKRCGSEQRWIDELGTWHPERGFNVDPAVSVWRPPSSASTDGRVITTRKREIITVTSILPPILDDALVLIRKRAVMIHKRVLNSSKAREDANQAKAKARPPSCFVSSSSKPHCADCKYILACGSFGSSFTCSNPPAPAAPPR